jgi:hypothetical protein
LWLEHLLRNSYVLQQEVQQLPMLPQEIAVCCLQQFLQHLQWWRSMACPPLQRQPWQLQGLPQQEALPLLLLLLLLPRAI